MNERPKMADSVAATVGSSRGSIDGELIRGIGTFEVRGPDGELKQYGEFHNLITDRGDDYYASLGAGNTETVATGMRLGTGTTAVSKGGAGAAIVTYVAGSQKAFDTKADSDKGAGLGHRIAWVASWAAGVATASGIAEVVITNESPLTDVAGTATNTIARALLSPTVNKGADDTLTITWNHDFLGA